MKKLGIALAAGAAVVFLSTASFAGPLQLVATNAKGKQIKAGKYGRWTRVYRDADLKRLKAATRKQYRVKATLCGQSVMLRTIQQRWIAAHRKAKHKVVLRERIAKGKYKEHCVL